MKKLSLLLLFILPVIAFAQITVEYQPGPEEGVDAVISGRSFHLDSPNPHNKFFHAMSWTFDGTPANIRSIIKFDLNNPNRGIGIPQDAIIEQADLFLYGWEEGTAPWDQYHSVRTGSNEGWLRMVKENWSESAVTWNNQPALSNGEVYETPIISDKYEDLRIDVTDHIQYFVANPDLNFGWMMYLQTEEH